MSAYVIGSIDGTAFSSGFDLFIGQLLGADKTADQYYEK